jgi:CHAT domain-containing protein/tetratricopeptide (TPR) repeat protein
VSLPSKKDVPSKRQISELASITDAARRKAYLTRHRELFSTQTVTQLSEAVVERVRVDRQQALALAQAAIAIARRTRSREALARGFRAQANALYALGQNRQALRFHKQAARGFERAGNSLELGRTLSTSLQPLILLGEYDRALRAVERAREIFARLGERRRLARLDLNTGNIFHRQDRFTEALACYERAYEQLVRDSDKEGIAVALSNMAVTLISLNDFPRALETYDRARAFCEQNDMPLLRSQADYNIAYLHYLRGEYTKAIQMLHAAREECRATGDTYHLALCHLDLSEIYLELNLSAEAGEMAHEGALQFQKLGMGYEEAKARTNEAIAFGQQGKALLALGLFRQARARFVREKNLVWPWLIDLYQALLLFNEGRFFEARKLCAGAIRFFESSILPGKAILGHLLLARLALRTGDVKAAREECQLVRKRLATLEAPVLQFQAQFLLGQIEEAAGEPESAYRAYRGACDELETLRSSLRAEELKIAFMKNKLEVYERLVELCLGEEGRPQSAEEALGYMELAKSRSLTELLLQRGYALPAAESKRSDLVRRMQELREELNWYYHRIELEQLSPETPSQARIESLEKQAKEREQEFLRALRDASSSQPELGAFQASARISIDEIRASLPPDTDLLEYFATGDRLVAAVVTREALDIVPVTLVSRVVQELKLLRLQLSKFRLGPAYLESFREAILEATKAHLRKLYEELLAPLRGRIRGRHLLVVPHGVLHYVPFHALFDGQQYLIDAQTVSYVPSASIHALCQSRASTPAHSSLVLGVPDSRAPHILDEVQAVAGILPSAELFVGVEATEKLLRERGECSRIIHIATHGRFRQDNPLFSGIRLGDSYLNLYDLYQMRLTADLVTLSGCATGMNVVAAGDELLGLIRGLLSAGARCLLLSLWDVHDLSTAELMRAFYLRLQEGEEKARALQQAMLELRQEYPHPYYWAPFMLVGKVSAGGSTAD